MPVMPDSVEEGYLITQAIADYLAIHPGLNLDGIIYRSVQSSDGKSTLASRNVILFNKASKVRGSNNGFDDRIAFNLLQYDDGDAHIDPELWVHSGYDHDGDTCFDTRTVLI